MYAFLDTEEYVMTDTEEYVITDTEEYVITDTDTLFKVVGHYGPPPALIRVKMRKIFQHFLQTQKISILAS